MTEDRAVDVNKRVTEEWVEETTPGERVHTVMKRTYEPQTVATIAERAQTTPTTARKHLRRLVEDGFVDEITFDDDRGSWYKRANRSVVLERAHRLLNEVDEETLAARVAEMRETVREFEARTNAESPEAAVVNGSTLDSAEMTEWQTTRRNLKLARAALALADAEDVVGSDDVTGDRGESKGVVS
jgi:DNA-binding MarR family transcriptional regulator